MKKTIKLLTSAILCLLVAVGSFATLPKTVSAVDDGIWVDSLAEPTNYAYSLAVVGDTQYVTMYQPKALKNMYKWIADNAAAKKMQYVIGVGDITHTDGAVEWANAYDAISQLDGKVGYALVRGNHDIRTSYYDYHFGRNEALYSKQYFDAFNSGKVTQARNTAHEFEVAGKKYLIICLDFGAKDDVLAWANEVVASHPSHTVIVTTHAYMYRDGSILTTQGDSPSSYDPTLNSGKGFYDKFIKKHKNISLVLCGHVFNENIVKRTDVGDNGNVITSLMINPQYFEYNKNNVYDPDRLTGMVALLYFSQDGKTVDVQWYSTIKNKFFNPEVNAFRTSMHVTPAVNPYVSVIVRGHGSATPNYTEYEAGYPVRINITPDEYYEIASLTKDGKDVTSKIKQDKFGYYYQFTPSEDDHHLTVVFKDQNRYLLLEQNELAKGAIVFENGVPNATYEENEEITFSIAPKVGWLVESVTFNGEKITANETGLYTITIKAQDNILAVNYSSEDASKVQEGGNLSNQDNNIIQENEPVQEKIGCDSSLLGTSLVSSLAVVLSALIALAIRRK